MALTLPDFFTRSEDAYLRVKALVADILPQLVRQTMSQQGARLAVSEVEAILEALRQIRLDLDTTDTAAWIVDPTDPVDVMNMVVFEREMRSRLGRVSQELANLGDLASRFAEGDDFVDIMASDEATLQGLAQTHLRDWRRWRDIVEANPEAPVDTVAPGAVLRMPRTSPGR